MKRRQLRSGYTTGACAAAAAKAAALILLTTAEGVKGSKGQRVKDSDTLTLCNSDTVEIPFPDGSRRKFRIRKSEYRSQNKTAYASVIKDAGDDPDVTNGAAIAAEAGFISDFNSAIRNPQSEIKVKGGKGVGIVTKPGLSVPVGEPAINPVPMRMIKEAVMEAITDCGIRNVECGMKNPKLVITISVPDGEKLAKKTLNHRLGIVGGISILGTTGIVRPISAEAWTATITSSMHVAKAMGRDEIVLSAGRSSEKAHMDKFKLPQESYVMMGDYLEFALLEAKKHEFKKIHLCAQWAKMLKIAMATPQTHVRHGAIDIKKAVDFLGSFQSSVLSPQANPSEAGSPQPFNTAMEIFNFIVSSCHSPIHTFTNVCIAAKKYAESITTGIPVISYLVSYEGKVIANSE